MCIEFASVELVEFVIRKNAGRGVSAIGARPCLNVSENTGHGVRAAKRGTITVAKADQQTVSKDNKGHDWF